MAPLSNCIDHGRSLVPGMKLYQNYWWNPTHGPQVRFFANKRDAIKDAKKVLSETPIDVSLVNLPNKKSDIIAFINNLGCTEPINGEQIAEFIANYKWDQQ